MGQACCAVCEPVETLGGESVDGSCNLIPKRLSTFELDDDAPPAERRALQALLEAVSELRRGDRATARERLAAATKLLDGLPEGSELQRAYQADVELRSLLAAGCSHASTGKPEQEDDTPVTSAGGSPSPSATSSGSLSPKEVSDPAAPDPLLRQLEEVLHLCGRSRILDAGAALKALDARVLKAQADSSLKVRLTSDPLLQRLREAHLRMSDAIRVAMVPAMRKDVSWTTVQVKEPRVSPQFVTDVRLRHAEPHEREANGPATQLIMGATVRGFPLDLSKAVALFAEVDLFQHEWVKDCERLEGRSAMPEEVRSGFVFTQMAPRMLPVKLEDTVRRDFAVRAETTPEGLRPGVLLLEADPPHGASECEGWEIPAPRRGYVRLHGSMKLHHLMPSVHGPGMLDAESAMRIGCPLPSWAVPLDLIKRFLADVWAASVRKLKLGPIDHFDALPYGQRLADRAAFYAQVEAIQQAQHAPPPTPPSAPPSPSSPSAPQPQEVTPPQSAAPKVAPEAAPQAVTRMPPPRSPPVVPATSTAAGGPGLSAVGGG